MCFRRYEKSVPHAARLDMEAYKVQLRCRISRASLRREDGEEGRVKGSSPTRQCEEGEEERSGELPH